MKKIIDKAYKKFDHVLEDKKNKDDDKVTDFYDVKRYLKDNIDNIQMAQVAECAYEVGDADETIISVPGISVLKKNGQSYHYPHPKVQIVSKKNKRTNKKTYSYKMAA